MNLDNIVYAKLGARIACDFCDTCCFDCRQLRKCFEAWQKGLWLHCPSEDGVSSCGLVKDELEKLLGMKGGKRKVGRKEGGDRPEGPSKAQRV